MIANRTTTPWGEAFTDPSANPLQSPQAGGLLPCPFCGGTPEPTKGRYVFCGGCSADGPYDETDPNGAWNRRASTPAPSGLAGEAVAFSTSVSEETQAALKAIDDGQRAAAAYIVANPPLFGHGELAATPSIPAGGVGEALTRLEQFISAESADGNSDTIVSLRFLREIASALARATLSQPAGGVAVSDAELLDAMAKNIRLELSWGEVSDFEGEPCQWRVHERTGNRNDREWHIRGVGDTPRAALEAALSPEAKTGERS